MKDFKKATFAILFMLTAVVLTACGGGGGGTTPGGGGGGGTFNAAVSKGVINATGPGFIVVNNVTYSTAGAVGKITIDDKPSAVGKITIDDAPSAADLLKPGMVVTVKGSSEAGTATEIEARDALEGTISAVGANTITVMGQTVQIEDNVTRLSDDNTVKTFAGANFQAGERVEIHGFADDNGGLRATRAVKKASGEFEIKGFVTSTGATFGLALTPGGIATLNVTGTLPAGAVVGSIVEVKSNAAPVGNAITATSVTLENRLEDKAGAAGAKVEVEGIAASGDVNSFVVSGQRVVTTAATVFEGGLKSDFLLGVKVEAEGTIDAAGVITATKVSFRSNIKIEGDASNVTATSLQVLGKTVTINPDPMTRIDNGPLANGQHVEVRAILGSDGSTLVATRVRVRNADTRAFLQGPVAVASGAMTILGTPITTGASTEFRISSDSTDAAVTSTAFFAALQSGVTVVKVRWRPFSSLTAAVDQAEIQLGKTLSSSGDDSSKGVVTKLGSVFVNGVEFHTKGAAVMINGVPSTEDKLKVGMVVNVRGTIDDATGIGTATLVEANNTLAGTIQAKDDAAKTITVMGQAVQIEDNVTNLLDDSAKVFTPTDFAVGERVEVHGMFDDQGKLRATRVVKDSGEFQVKGFVMTTGSTFDMSLTSGGAKAFSVTGTLPAGAKVGSIVEVHATAAPANGAITATSVKLEDSIEAKGEKVRVEGIISTKTDADNSFTINDKKVVMGTSTIFEGGLKSDLAVGVKVEAQGSLNADGSIAASKVAFRGGIKIEGVVSGFSAAGMTINGMTIVTNESTRLKDSTIVDGNQVEVRAFVDNKNNIVATRVVKRSNVDGKAFLQGPAKLLSASSMSILGVTINTTGANFRVSTDQVDVTKTSAEFFAGVKDGISVVKVRWDPAPSPADAASLAAAAVKEAEIQTGK